MKPVEKNPTEMDWARAAAFLDGEGSIFLRNEDVHGTRRTYLYVDISNTDIRLSNWLKDTFGGGICSMKYENRPDRWVECFQWRVSHRKATWVLNGCLPFLIVKREQAELALAHQRLVAIIVHAPRKDKAALVDKFQEERQQMRVDLSGMKTAGRINRRTTAIVQ